MDHLLLKAAATVTDEGVFQAVISTATPDREGDVVQPSAMAAALAKWADLGKLVPLAWNHSDEIVGHVDPGTVRIEDDEVIANGKIDQTTKRGEDAWRLVKSGTLSFSFGYLIPDGGATKRAGGRLDIRALDVFEISVVPIAPANNDTRVLAWKSLEERDRVLAELQEVKARLDTLEKALEDQKKKAEEAGKETKSRSVDPLRDHARQIAQEVMRGGVTPPTQVKQAPQLKPDMSPDELREHARDLIVHVLSGKEET